MASSFSFNQDKKCGVCRGSLTEGEGQAIFTATCCHSFHFTCIISHPHRCPVCNATWNQCFDDDEPLPANTTSLPAPANAKKVTVKAVPERPAVAASESLSAFTLLVGLRAPPMLLSEDAPRAAVDIVTVLDVSGSMSGMKIDLVKRAVNFVIDNLGGSDRLSVVSFSDEATRLVPLMRMRENGREDAKRAVGALRAGGGTNIVQGLTVGARILAQRKYRNPVSAIIFLSDGNDTHNSSYSYAYGDQRSGPEYLHKLPASIYPRNGSASETYPVHSFGFGSDHDPMTMHAISDASGGTFSYIESYKMIQDAFAGCIGGLLSVVTQELRLGVRSASHGVEIKSISAGRYASEVSGLGSEGVITVGDLYADEEKEFLINISVPAVMETERKTTLLDVKCSYKDAVSKEAVEIEGDLVEIRRPGTVEPQDKAVNLEVDRQRNRLFVAESIKQAQLLAETGDFEGAKTLLAKQRGVVVGSAAGQAGDGMCAALDAEMKETERLMGSRQAYQESGRAFALAGMSSHAAQRATTRGELLMGCAAPGAGNPFEIDEDDDDDMGCAGVAYVTPNMARMIRKSKQATKDEDNENGVKKN